MTEVTSWYNNKSIFVTGATGFVGRCLVEKLLRVCPGISAVYITVRDKNDVKFEDRVNAYSKHVAFSKLAAENPMALKKIRFVKGDINKVNLGMSEADIAEVTEEVSVVFHSAADVHFDRRLVEAYAINVGGTKHTLDFATQIKHLEVVQAWDGLAHIMLYDCYFPGIRLRIDRILSNQRHCAGGEALRIAVDQRRDGEICCQCGWEDT